jgi:replicative DNA helicase
MIEAQESLIASMLMEPACVVNVIDRVSSADFTTSRNKSIFDVILDMTNRGVEPEIFAVAEVTNELPYLTDLLSNAHRMNVGAAVTLVKRESGRRKALSNLEAAIQDVLASKSVEEQIMALEKVTDGVEIEEAEFSTLPEIMKRAIQRLKDKIDGKTHDGIKTGYTAIDERLGGLVNGNMIVVGARPSMGKTTYAMNVAECVADAGKNVLIFSLEMSEDELADRMIASASEISNSIIRKPLLEEGGFDQDKQARLHAGMMKVNGRRGFLSIVDKPALHIDHLRNIARKFDRTKKVELIVIDYLQLITSSDKNRFDEVSTISRGIKSMAKELNVPVIVLSQLNREVDKRKPARPMNSDLRESGQIEQDADIIQFLYRDEVYNKDDSNPNKGLVEIITAKFRNGETGTDYLESRLEYSKFINTKRYHVEAATNEYKPYTKRNG